MNRPNKKIAAFTLLELMVTLTLTALIVGLSYFAYNYLLQGFVKYREINENIGQHCVAQNYLDNILQRCDQVIKKKDGVEFTIDETNRKTLKISENYLLFLNADNTPDTVKLKIIDYKLYWKTDSILPDNGPVQKIKLNIDFSARQHTLIFEKLYDSEKLIKLDSLDKALR